MKITPERVCKALEELELIITPTSCYAVQIDKYQQALDLVYKFCHLANCSQDSKWCNNPHEDWQREFEQFEEFLYLENHD